MEAWTDSLLDTDRAIRRPITVWTRELIRSLDTIQGQWSNAESRDSAVSISSNNYALMLYLLGEHALAEQACQRQIRFASRHLPVAAIQPHINLIRLYRGIGRYESASRFIDELLEKRDEVARIVPVQGIRSGSEFLEEIYLHESFLLKLKVSGPGELPKLLSAIEAKFPVLGESVAFAERMVMAGMLCDDAELVHASLSKVCWLSSPHNKLVRTVYSAWWLAGQGDRRQAVHLLQHMAKLGAAAYQWRDHVILRLLERLFSLARFVEEDALAYQFNNIRSRAAGRIGDVHAAIVTAFHRRGEHGRSRHAWRNIASRSGYKFMPGIPGFVPRKRTLAEARVLMGHLDSRIGGVYRRYETSDATNPGKHPA
jgi:tetratricopeptide (TPR) repeat protein